MDEQDNVDFKQYKVNITFREYIPDEADDEGIEGITLNVKNYEIEEDLEKIKDNWDQHNYDHGNNIDYFLCEIKTSYVRDKLEKIDDGYFVWKVEVVNED